MSQMIFDLKQKQTPAIKQLQHLMMTHHMQQAIQFLQMPVMELSPLIDQELQQNPLLEAADEDQPEQNTIEEQEIEASTEAETSPEIPLTFNDRDFEVMRRLDEDFRSCFTDEYHPRTSNEKQLETFLESSIVEELSLFEHLMNEAKQIFSDPKELSLAQAIIGNIDSHGFLSTSLHEIAALEGCSIEMVEKVLKIIQQFEPPGIGARDLHEALLLQLERRGKKDTIAYKIIDEHFDDLIHNRIPTISKQMHCTPQEVRHAIEQDMQQLDLHPGNQLDHQQPIYVIPDISLRQEEENLVVCINEEGVPRLRFNRRYMRMLEDPALSQETKQFIEQKLSSAKWLMRNLFQRNNTLEKIGELLVARQQQFLVDPKGVLVPMTMRQVAEELHVHESTVARAVSNKYIDTPKGILPLRFFFTSALAVDDGEDTSSAAVRQLIAQIVAQEDKQKPLSDESISALLKEKGIACARRTVVKYRQLLGIGNARQRRQWGHK